MIIYKRFLGFLISFLIASSLIFTHYYPEKILYCLFFSIFCFLLYFFTIKNRFVKYSFLFKCFLIVLLFSFSLGLFFIVIDLTILKYILAVILFIALAMIFDTFFKKFYQNQEISHFLIVYIDLFCFWFMSYFLFYVVIFLRWNLLWTALLFFITVLVLFSIRLYWQKIDFKKNIVYVIIGAFILVEVYIITSFLALNFYSSVFMLWVWYYLIIDFFIDKIKDEFIWSNKRKIIFFVILLFILYLLSIRLR